MVNFVCEECGDEVNVIYKIIYESDEVKSLCKNCELEAIESEKDAITQFDFIYKIIPIMRNCHGKKTSKKSNSEKEINHGQKITNQAEQEIATIG